MPEASSACRPACCMARPGCIGIRGHPAPRGDGATRPSVRALFLVWRAHIWPVWTGSNSPVPPPRGRRDGSLRRQDRLPPEMSGTKQTLTYGLLRDSTQGCSRRPLHRALHPGVPRQLELAQLHPAALDQASRTGLCPRARARGGDLAGTDVQSVVWGAGGRTSVSVVLGKTRFA